LTGGPWSDVNRASLIYVALYADRPIFLKSADPGTQRHDAQFIANTTLDVINQNDQKNYNLPHAIDANKLKF